MHQSRSRVFLFVLITSFSLALLSVWFYNLGHKAGVMGTVYNLELCEIEQDERGNVTGFSLYFPGLDECHDYKRY